MKKDKLITLIRNYDSTINETLRKIEDDIIIKDGKYYLNKRTNYRYNIIDEIDYEINIFFKKKLYVVIDPLRLNCYRLNSAFDTISYFEKIVEKNNNILSEMKSDIKISNKYLNKFKIGIETEINEYETEIKNSEGDVIFIEKNRKTKDIRYIKFLINGIYQKIELI